MKNSVKFIILFLLSVLFSNMLNGQIIDYKEESKKAEGAANAQILEAKVLGEDTLLQVVVDEIVIYPERVFKNEKQKIKYTQLMYNVKKVYPYSKIISSIYAEIELEISKAESKKDVKQYINAKEKELTDKFEGVIREMTYSQGRVLIKLVDRETGSTTYEVVKELKGSVNAFFWQSIALLFDSNLKLEYNPDDEDKMIEEIIAMIENGQI